MAKSDPSPKRDFAIQVVERLREGGHTAYWVGGCVRDCLLGHDSKDYDIATSARPEEVRSLFGHRRTHAVGAAFGVIIVYGSKEAGPIEVATFRTDASYSDGRRPDSVQFSSPEEDAQRRDFTINGLFYDPTTDEVIDYVGGQADLEQGILRAIGKPAERIAEDKLRMLRGIRFAMAFDFNIEASTAEAIKQHSPEVTLVSAERIADEMRKILRHPNRARGVALLKELGLLESLLPELMERVNASSQAWQKRLALLDRFVDPPFALALAALLYPWPSDENAKSKNESASCPKPVSLVDAAAVCTRWKLSKEESVLTDWLLAHESIVHGAHLQPWPQIQPLLVHADIQYLLQLAEGVAEGESQSDAGIVFCRERLQWPVEKLNPPPLLTGDTLIKAGLKPNKQFGAILAQVRDAQLEGEIASAEEALRLARQLYPQAK